MSKEKVKSIFTEATIHTRQETNNRKPEEFLDKIKQKLNLKMYRLKRYNNAQKRKDNNNI